MNYTAFTEKPQMYGRCQDNGEFDFGDKLQLFVKLEVLSTE